MIGISKITDEEGTAEPTGILIMGWILDEKAVEQIKGTLHSEIGLLTEGGTLLATSNEMMKQSLSSYLSDALKNTDFELFHIDNFSSIHKGQTISSIKSITNNLSVF